MVILCLYLIANSIKSVELWHMCEKLGANESLLTNKQKLGSLSQRKEVTPKYKKEINK
jgi:hypothetical protein